MIPLVMLALALIGYGERAKGQVSVCDTTITIDETELCTELVSTAADKKRGLGGRESLPANAGMLFVSQEDALHGIWMKNMNFSIDVLWLNSSGDVTYIEPNISPDSYPRVYRPFIPSRYILEVNAGFIEEHGVTVGDTLALDLNL